MSARFISALVIVLSILFCLVRLKSPSPRHSPSTRDVVWHETDTSKPAAVSAKTDRTVNHETENRFGTPANLPRPSDLSVHDFETKLYSFLDTRKYQELGWAEDKSVRDTGPYIKGRSYGTHPAVRVYYSPEVIGWLINGRHGTIPDGAVIIKEQYEEPAARHHGKTEAELRASLKSWTVMVKDSKGSHDGWFWSNPYPSGDDRTPKVVDNHKYPFYHPESGFGHYCVRCHAATQSPEIENPVANNEFTFSSLRNIKGFPGEPIIFRVDDSWRESAHKEMLASGSDDDSENSENEDLLAEVSIDATEVPQSHPKCTGTGTPEKCELTFNSSFTETFDQIPVLKQSDVLHLPPVTHDWVVKGAFGEQELATSNQCMSCHAGLVAPYGPSMFVGYEKDEVDYYDPGWHISPYGEWRWTPMGLAGRDPIFFSQLESEIELLKKEFSDDPAKAKLIGENLADTCLRCHGAMGKHQFDRDKKSNKEKFSLEHMYLTAKKDQHIGHHDAKYGALGRDGISCMVCHRSVPREQPADDDRPYLQFFLETSITGNFKLGPSNEIYGPFKDNEISPYVMEHGIAVKPKYNEYIQSSRMCGTCHTVTLPVVDHPFDDEVPIDAEQLELINAENVPLFKKFHHHVEQATYLEWLNSDYENEFDRDNPNAKSCQDCHMSKDLHDDENNIHIEQISTRIATVQDNTYPDAENLTELENLEIRYRETGYKRHNFVGLNVFLIELFRQFDEVLGVRKNDFMTGSSKDIEHAVRTYQRQAKNDVVDLHLKTELTDSELVAHLEIINKVGHRFPSGVGFRRAFVELTVTDVEEEGEEKLLW
ncbi:MAG: cytochrome P460 family protein, partial [Planctomycetota bacterium]